MSDKDRKGEGKDQFTVMKYMHKEEVGGWWEWGKCLINAEIQNITYITYSIRVHLVYLTSIEENGNQGNKYQSHIYMPFHWPWVCWESPLSIHILANWFFKYFTLNKFPILLRVMHDSTSQFVQAIYAPVTSENI